MKIKFQYASFTIGIILFIYSWISSYPIAYNSPYLFLFNDISILYWISLLLIFGSSYFIHMNTQNKFIKYLITIISFSFIYSKSYFHFIIPGSDTNQFFGYTEAFILSEDLSLSNIYNYYQWPLFFLLNRITMITMNINLNLTTHFIYFIMGIMISSLIYRYATDRSENGYIAVMFFSIMLFYFINYQWAPYTISIIPTILILYLDKNITSFEGVLFSILIFIALCYYHIIPPISIILYYLINYFFVRNRKYLNLFLISSIIYVSLISYRASFESILIKISDVFLFSEFSRTISQVTVESVAKRPFIDYIAQMMSRSVVLLSGFITIIGFILILRKRKLSFKEYSIFLSGMIFLPTVVTSFRSYPQIFWRALPFSFLPFSLGASHIFGLKKYSKIVTPLFLIIILSFNFVLIHNIFFDNEIFTFSENEYDQNNFLIDKINYNRVSTNKILSHFRTMMYFRTRIGENVNNYYDAPGTLNNFENFDYVVYTVGLGKTAINNGYNIEEFYIKLEKNNIIYSNGRGNIYHVVP